MEQGMALSYVTLFVADLATSLIFYHERLGLPIIEESNRFCLLRAGTVAIGLHAADDPARRSRGVNLHFAVADAAAAVARARGRGLPFADPRDEPWGQRVARTADPDGNEVELVQELG